ncbi:MAG: head GIN domain-containing protein [Flammeovirgaceae bacterium]
MKKILIALLLVSTVGLSQNRETRNVGAFTRIAFRIPGKLILKQGSPQKVELEGDRELLKKIETEVDGDRLSVGRENRWMDWNWSKEDRVNVYITMPDIEGLSVSGSGDLVGEGKFNTGDLKLSVSGSGTLQIEVAATGDIDANVSGSGRLQVGGTCKGFESDVSGSGRVIVNAKIDGMADVGISGSGKIEASGTAQSIKATISGSGRVYASNLEVDKCTVRISGSGDVEINVKSELDANISGSGTVSYKGNPSHVNGHSSGSGKVKKM